MRRRGRNGMALITVLWVMAILAVMAAGYAVTVRLNIATVRNFEREAQALSLAEAGIQAAILSIQADEDGVTTLTEEYSEFSAEDQFGEEALVTGTFQVRVYDLAARLDINAVEPERLLPLLGDPELVAAVTDWMDEDTEETEGGAEIMYYQSLDPPYAPRNGPLQSIGELALVRGFDRDMLYGDLDELYQQRDVAQPRGLIDLLATVSCDSNLTLDGQPRININIASSDALQQALGDVLQPEQIEAIISYREERGAPETPAEETPTPETEEMPAEAPSEGPGPAAPSRPSSGAEVRRIVRLRQVPDGREPSEELPELPGTVGTPTPAAPEEEGAATAEPPTEGFTGIGELLMVPGITREQVQQIADRVTVTNQPVIRGRININTAPLQVLACLAELGETLAQSIVEYRQTEPFQSVGDLLKVPDLEDSVFVAIADKVTVRSYLFEIESYGVASDGNVARRLTCAVDLSGDEPNILYCREG